MRKNNSLQDNLSLWGFGQSTWQKNMLLDHVEKKVTQQSNKFLLNNDITPEKKELIKKNVQESLGLYPFPKKQPLKVTKTGEIQKQGYSIEKMILEAWPGVTITAHLYLPAERQPMNPGLLYTCGHWVESGKLAPTIQTFCANAAKLGIITLVYDPIGQGERFESWLDHSYLNALLIGKCQLGLMVWESIRCIDYLLSRDDINPDRIGMTGSSGGGLNTLFTTAVDDRIYCSVPVAYPCTFSGSIIAERDLNWEDGADVCNQVPAVLSYSEMSDIVSLFIPKPYLIVSGTRDLIFPVNETKKIAQIISKNYADAGVPDHFLFVEHDEGHGYQKSLRQTAYSWLRKWLFDESEMIPIVEAEIDLIPDPFPVEYSKPPKATPEDVSKQSMKLTPQTEALQGYCLPVDTIINNGKAIDDSIKAEYYSNPIHFPKFNDYSDFNKWKKNLQKIIWETLRSSQTKKPIRPRIYNQIFTDNKMIEKIEFESEDGINIPGLLIMPLEWRKAIPIMIYVGEWGKNQGISSGFIESVIENGIAVLAVDVRGVGETAASDFEAATNLLMLNESLFGQRVWDVIRSIDFVWERCYLAPQIDKGGIFLCGDGIGALWALFASALDDRVAGVIGKGALLSYEYLLDHSIRFPASVYLHQVLNKFDITDVIISNFNRPVYLNPVNGNLETVSPSDEKIISLTAVVDSLKITGERVKISQTDDDDEIINWIKNLL